VARVNDITLGLDTKDLRPLHFTQGRGMVGVQRLSLETGAMAVVFGLCVALVYVLCGVLFVL
jgi:hypothetical protein